MSEELFTVWTFFSDGTYSPDGPPVNAEQAVKRAKGITESVGAVCGMIDDVKIVDGGDNTVFHWVKDDGIIFPKL